MSAEPCRDRTCRSHAALERARAIAVALEQENAVLRGVATRDVCSCGNSFDGDNFCMPSACQWET